MPNWLSKRFYHYTFLTAMSRVTFVLHTCQKVVFLDFLDFFHSNRCTVISCLNLHFHGDILFFASFYMLSHHLSSLGQCLFRYFKYFKIRLLVVLLNFKDFFVYLDMNTLSYMYLAVLIFICVFSSSLWIWVFI